MKKILFLLSLVLLAGCGSLDDSIWTPRPVEIDPDAIATGGLPEGNFTPGTFTGVGTGGFYGDIHVEVTFSDTAMTVIEVVHHMETPPFAYPAFERLTADMLRLQTHDVDVLANATMTSEAFIEAVWNAMMQSIDGAPAPAPPTPTPPPDEPEPDEVIADDEDADDEADEAEADAEPDIEPEPTPEPDEPERDEPEQGDTEQPDASATGFTPGTFSGSGQGYYGPITVSVTFDENSIISINITDHEDTQMFVDMVATTVPPAIIAAQSTDVDNVTGATATSQGIREAVNAAIQEASN